MTQNRIPETVFRKLCALERKLHKWAEDECNGAIQWEDPECTIPKRYYRDKWGDCTRRGELIVNHKALWLKEAETLAAECGGRIYHQGDPRGCALYFYRDSDLEGRRFPIDLIYSSAALACC